MERAKGKLDGGGRFPWPSPNRTKEKDKLKQLFCEARCKYNFNSPAFMLDSVRDLFLYCFHEMLELFVTAVMGQYLQLAHYRQRYRHLFSACTGGSECTDHVNIFIGI